MPYALARTVKGWIVNASGTNDPADLFERINAIRREWYSWYSEMNLFVDVEECFEVQSFALDCNACQNVVRGLTLPRYAAAVEAMWYNDFPVRLGSRWRQWHEGIGSPYDCGLQKDDLGDYFPSERDILPCTSTQLRVHALNAQDKGKTVVIRGDTLLNGLTEETLTLAGQPQLTTNAFKSISHPGGFVKEATAGRVALSEASGRLLSVYDPDETVPAYKRISISGLPTGRQFVNIRAARQYTSVLDEMDVCETDNQRAWEAMASYLRLNRKQDRTRDDLVSEGAFLTQARTLLLGDKSREIGKATRSQVRILTPGFSRHSLGRVRRRW